MRLLVRPALFNRGISQGGPGTPPGRHRHVREQPRAVLMALFAALCLALLAGCLHHKAGAPPLAPSITSFTATDPSIVQGASTTLTAVFTGGTATIDQQIGAVQSGVAVSTGNLTADRTFTLTVTGDGGVTATRTVQVKVTVRHPLSGNAGVPGAVLAYTEGTAMTATADATGAYSFTVPDDWSGTVTPSLAGHAFTPPSRTYAHVLAELTAQDFTAVAVTLTISGNAGVAGAVLAYTDGTARTAVADASGSYTLTVPYNWSGTVTPSSAGSTFSPASRTYTNVQANLAAENYTLVVLHLITGTTSVTGTTLAYTVGEPTTATAMLGGFYILFVPDHWSGTVTPSCPGYTFTPPSRTYTDVQTDLANQDFGWAPVTYAISGNAGAPGATLAYTDSSPRTVTADASGAYRFTVPFNWSGTVTPSLPGHAFTPPSRSYANLLASQAGQDFTANTGPDATIAGHAGLAGTTLTYTDGTVKTATADAGGNYSFPVSYNWSGTVTPSAPDRHSFTPLSRTYTRVLASLVDQDYLPNPGLFTASPNMNSPRVGQTSTLLANGRILLAGGSGNDATFSAELYDPAAGTFTPTKDTVSGRFTFCVPRSGHTATLLRGGKVLLAGGQNGTTYLDAEIFDPATGVFTATAGPMLTPRANHTATLLPSGKVLIAGGTDFILWSGGGTTGGNLASAELFDPATGRFSATGSLTGPRRGQTADLLPSGKVLIAGGASYSVVSVTGVAELYDPEAGAFTATGSMVNKREYHTSTLLPSGKVLFIGGQDGMYYASTELYDPATGLFTPSGTMGVQRRLHTATLLANGKVLVTGGQWTDFLDTAECYDPATEGFTPTGYMVLKRVEQCATALPNGKVLLTGGYGTEQTAEVYDPQDPAPGFPWFAYSPAAFQFTKDLAITGSTPQATGATAWTLAPALPAGLAFSPTTGAITGTPTVAGAQAHLVTASNGTNQTRNHIWITVSP